MKASPSNKTMEVLFMSYNNLNDFYLTKDEAVEALAAYNASRSDEEQLFYIPYFDEWQNRKVYIICHYRPI